MIAKWIRRLIHRWAGPDKYHDHRNALNNRGLRLELLEKRLAVIDRRESPR